MRRLWLHLVPLISTSRLIRLLSPSSPSYPLTKNKLWVAIPLLLSILLTGCNFHLQRKGASLQAQHPSIFIPIFQNNTTQLIGAEKLFTKAAIKHFETMKIKTSNLSAPIRLIGSLTNIRVRSSGQTSSKFSTQPLTSLTTVFVTLRLEMKETQTGKTIWKNTSTQSITFPISRISQQKLNALNIPYNKSTTYHYIENLAEQMLDSASEQVSNYF